MSFTLHVHADTAAVTFNFWRTSGLQPTKPITLIVFPVDLGPLPSSAADAMLAMWFALAFNDQSKLRAAGHACIL
jgi:hypothetical protein